MGKGLTRHSIRFLLKTSLAASLAVVMACGAAFADENETEEPDQEALLETRRLLLEAAATGDEASMEKLQSALHDDSDLIRRTAVHLLVRAGENGTDGLVAALDTDDVQVRRVAVKALAQTGALDGQIAQVATDPDDAVRRDFRLLILPETYLDDDGAPMDVLVEGLSEAYQTDSENLRLEITTILSELPVTKASERFLNRVSRDENEEIAELAIRTVIQPKLDRMAELSDAGEFETLIQEFGEAEFEEWPEDMAQEALRMRGFAYLQEEDESAAEADLETAMDLDPGDAVIARMNDLQDNRDYDTLIEEFAELDFTDWSEDQIVEVLLLRANAHFRQNDGEAAEKDLKAGLEISPTSVPALRLLARTYRDRLDDPERALETFLIAVKEASPTGARSYRARLETIDLLNDAGRHEESLELLAELETPRRGTFESWASRTWSMNFPTRRSRCQASLLKY